MGTGGRRIGAGRPATHVKAEHCRSLDIRHWHRAGVLEPGRAGWWQWTHAETGKQTASVGYRVHAEFVRLDYSIQGRPSGQDVSLTRTACNYGGTRPWFVCPVRGERVAVLYLRHERFACRHCQGVAHASRSEDAVDRSWRRQRNAEARLGAYWQRPAGMHHATHKRLVSIIWGCEAVRSAAEAKFFEVLKRRETLQQRN